ncbi:MAG: 16S rRNA (cytidine(1402)-2'-O)-methyltransferase [Bacteroidetes bacterium]|nr:MAG: 16S rRNA (cytidine(1402)-2'-O)-methyltransferase [Bacteroidota bacterium]RLD47259.1 MAG: 16S rRNA (cytidine(1402)-2'-O)-methyltransferase [Bacteroidota bacterium]RLD86381.1 MAG: 16S rRNA (cytidine(1402)-2'-O)-methyltransferase [Bacteroidota bacterium]
MKESKLYIVPTPIGNLEDMTLRAIRILKEVDVVLAEDTRTSGKLLKHFDIETRQYPYHQFNEHKVVTGLAERMAAGEKMALITDAGTPGISDPGFLLIRECIKNDIEVECLPGATAFVPALVQSGLPSDKFFFEGFLPHKKGRETRLKYLAEMPYTIVLYESPHRLLKTLLQLITHFGPDRKASVLRELTKLHEENARGTLQEIHDHFDGKTVKGEIVIVVGQPDK